jgi:hypothetical protein
MQLNLPGYEYMWNQEENNRERARGGSLFQLSSADVSCTTVLLNKRQTEVAFLD